MPGQELSIASLDDLPLEDRWILHRLDETVVAVTQGLEEYNPSTAINAARDFFWGSLCDWYLELIKARIKGDDGASAAKARRVLAYCLDVVLRLLHPFIPFVTEHLWQRLGEVAAERGLGSLVPPSSPASLIRAPWPRASPGLRDESALAPFAMGQEITRAVRDIRASAGVSPRDRLTATLEASEQDHASIEAGLHIVRRLAGIDTMNVSAGVTRPAGAAAAVVGTAELFVHDVIDDDAEKERLTREKAKVAKEIAQCEKKLGNPKFVDRAPAEVVQEQRQRLTRYQERLAAIERSLEQLSA